MLDQVICKQAHFFLFSFSICIFFITYSNFAESFVINGCQILLKAISAYIDMIMYFFFIISAYYG